MRAASKRDPFGGRGLRLTRQRKVVLDAVRHAHGHPSADEVYEMARRKLPRISLGTVYRTLGVLRDLGLVRELHFGRTQGRYEGARGPHYHVVCSECGRIEDVPAGAFGDLTRRARDVTRFDVKEQRLEFVGICPECRGGGKKESQPSTVESRQRS